MYSRFKLAFKYLSYYTRASNGRGHGVHSPFLFDFITTVLNDKTSYAVYDKVEGLRKQLLNDERLLSVQDLGAGSAVDHSDQRSVASIVRNAAKSKKYGQLLYRMVNKYRPRTILELGTSLGITTSYLALAGTASKIITLEGARDIAAMARQNFNQLQVPAVELIEGNFDQTVSSAIHQLPSVDFAFIDGNHRQEPTERYFQQLLPKISNDSIVVFDDIHWSAEMERAWATIRTHPAVRCSIDLFFIGIIFFRNEFKEKQDFIVRF